MFLVLLWLFHRARKHRLQGSATHTGAFPLASLPSSAFPNFHPHIQNVYSAPYSECHPQKPPAIAVLPNATQNLSHWAGVAPMGQPDLYSYRTSHQSGFHSPRLQVPFTSSPLSLSSANLDHPALPQYPMGGARPGAYRGLQHPTGGSAQSPPPEFSSAEGQLSHLGKKSTEAAERERVEELAGDPKLPAYTP